MKLITSNHYYLLYGIPISTLSEVSEILGVGKKDLGSFLRDGKLKKMIKEDDINVSYNFIYKGITYESQQECMKKNKFSRREFRNLIKFEIIEKVIR